MPLRVYLGWQQYYSEEPWGTWRDNMHTAIIAREIRATRSKKPSTMEDFMLFSPHVREQDAAAQAVTALHAIGKAMTAEESAAVRKATRRRRRK